MQLWPRTMRVARHVLALVTLTSTAGLAVAEPGARVQVERATAETADVARAADARIERGRRLAPEIGEQVERTARLGERALLGIRAGEEAAVHFETTSYLREGMNRALETHLSTSLGGDEHTLGARRTVDSPSALASDADGLPVPGVEVEARFERGVTFDADGGRTVLTHVRYTPADVDHPRGDGHFYETTIADTRQGDGSIQRTTTLRRHASAFDRTGEIKRVSERRLAAPHE